MMNMRSRTHIVLVLFIGALTASAQDTATVRQSEVPVSIMRPSIPKFLLEQPTRFASFQLDIVSGRSVGGLNRWGMYSPEFFDMTSTGKIDLTAPLKLQMMKQEENKLMYSILGSVQLGGTAYLLYRHIKKNKGIK
jgi:hypothetical protein